MYVLVLSELSKDDGSKVTRQLGTVSICVLTLSKSKKVILQKITNQHSSLEGWWKVVEETGAPSSAGPSVMFGAG